MITTNSIFYDKEITSTDSIIFEEYHISDEINIQNDKPEISKVVEFLSYPEIKKTNLINKSCDVYDNTGNKLMIEVDLKEKMIYTTKTQSGYVYTYNKDTLKNLNISLPKYIKDKSSIELVKSGRLQVNSYVENIHIKKIDSRNVYRTMLLLLEFRFFI